MNRSFALLGAALLLAGCHKEPKPAAPSGPPVVTVLATGDVWGQVEPCG